MSQSKFVMLLVLATWWSLIPAPTVQIVMPFASAGKTLQTTQESRPHNGHTIGHIINLTFLPLVDEPCLAPDDPQMLSYGSCALGFSVSRNIESDLLAIFRPNDAMQIMAVAIIKTVHPGVCTGRLQQQHNRTFARCY